MVNHALSDGQRFLTVRLPIGVYNSLKEQATTRGYMTTSEMVRDIIRKEIERPSTEQMQQQEARGDRTASGWREDPHRGCPRSTGCATAWRPAASTFRARST